MDENEKRNSDYSDSRIAKNFNSEIKRVDGNT